jgi:putative addiction module component (TIGR02574 family)
MTRLPNDRMELVDELLDSVADDELDENPADVEAAWAEEIKRRVDEIRNGTAETYALEDVLAEMEERYG